MTIVLFYRHLVFPPRAQNNFMLTPISGILVAVEVLSGKYLGAKKPHIIYRVTRNGIVLGLAYVAMYRRVGRRREEGEELRW